MRTDYLCSEDFKLLLTACMPENRLALLTSMHTGLRIGDVLALRTKQILTNRTTVREQKTGKAHRVYFPADLLRELRKIAGRVYVFEGRLTPYKHRTRSAVYKDLKRVARLYRLRGSAVGVNLAPHSARKIYAVTQYHKDGNLQRVQHLLNHEQDAVTMLYALADELTARKK